MKSTTSVFAEEGTAAHALSEHKLRKLLGIKSKRPKSDFDSEDLDYYTDTYVGFAEELITEARGHCKDPVIMLEQRLDYSKYCQEGFGTGDLIIVADDILDIVDLKYGTGVAVYSENNPQMRLYALGAFLLFEELYDIKKIRMTIVQPRLENISTSEISVEELLDWAENILKPAAELAYKGEGDFYPSEYTCRFCKAKSICRARADANMEVAKYDFAPILSDSEIEELLPKLNGLIDWANALYSYAQEKAIHEGFHWNGFKVVEGRSNRRYTDEATVAEAVTKAGFTDIYKKSLIGITEMERLLGKKRFNEILGNLVEKPHGKLSLVDENDKRPAVDTVAADFKEEN